MPRIRRPLAALAAALVVLAAPAPALAQSAGDDQYQDPFGGNSGGDSSGNGGSPDGGGSAPSAPAPAPAPATPAADPAPVQPAATAPAGVQLPYTGSPVPAALLAAAGTLLLAGGITLRIRLREHG
jgi:hypothetical protein